MDFSSFWPWQWWSIMVAINVVSFVIGVFLFSRSAKSTEAEQQRYLKWMRTLGLIFISVGLYRSIFVSSYLEQLAWFDSVANSSLLIRGLAFFAELSFAGLFMLAMLQFNKELPDPDGSKRNGLMSLLLTKSPLVLFACIFIAQFFATSALVTKFEVLFAIEETLWGLAFLIVLPLALLQLRRVYSAGRQQKPRDLRMLRAFAVMNASWCLLYCSYSVFYHLPIEYWPHIIADLQSGNTVFHSGFNAVSDALFTVNETKDFAQWGGIGFLIWHSGYFSVCVWMVLFLMSGPRRLPPARNH